MGGPDLSATQDTRAVRLISTLAVAGAVAGLLIVMVHIWAQPRIEERQAQVLREAIQEVLASPARTTALYVVDGAITDQLPEGADSLALDRLFLGFDESDRPLGVAIIGEKAGFQDVIRLIFGYDPASRQVLGMKVLWSLETPGLGDKIEKDSAFVAEFDGMKTPLLGVKRGAARGRPGEVDMITGATISSRAVIAAINARLEVVAPLLEAYTGRSPAGDGGN
jgi:H+/Na+-translocating ferredoxin:NAD+ oxidoreductase subunit G